MGVSQDGFIAKADGNSDWVSKIDEELFLKRVREAGCVVIGKTTFYQYRGQIYPISGALNIVLTSEEPTNKETGLVFASSPSEALKIAEEHGLSEVLVSGGAKVADSFLNDGLLDEVFLTVHPIVLGEGIRLFEGLDIVKCFTLVDTMELGEGLIQKHYLTQK